MSPFPSPTDDRQQDREALFNFIHMEAQALGFRVAVPQKGSAIMRYGPSIKGFRNYAILIYNPPHIPNYLYTHLPGYVYDIAVADPQRDAPDAFLCYVFFSNGRVEEHTDKTRRDCTEIGTWEIAFRVMFAHILTSLRYLEAQVSECRRNAEDRADLYGLQ